MMITIDARPALHAGVALSLLALAAATLGCAPADNLLCPPEGPVFVSEVVTTNYGTGQKFGRDQMPDVVLGPPEGAGDARGSTDVVSLGNGGSIVLAFGAAAIVDGAGVDFVVFENAFVHQGDAVFAELARVDVSMDGVKWFEFPCDAIEPPWGSCAGHRPVHFRAEDLNDEAFLNDVDAWGGDAFDLADVGLDEARYVRLTDRADLDGPDGVFDLDAVGIVHHECR